VDPVDLLPIGAVEEEALSGMEAAVKRALDLDSRRLPALPDPTHAYDPARKQYDSGRMLADVVASSRVDSVRTLGVTEADLFIPILTFVFGQAQVGGRAAIVSLARLRQEFYGLPPNPRLLWERAAKEALHELGHTLGLVHCMDTSCAASLSTNIRQLDAKGAVFCAVCAARVKKRLGSLAGPAPAGALEELR
jgi:archaemetzincin